MAELDQRLPVPDGYPADITAIVQQCWLSKPKERPTWKELAQKLKTAADILSVLHWLGWIWVGCAYIPSQLVAFGMGLLTYLVSRVAFGLGLASD